MRPGAELSFQILRYGAQKLAEGDFNALLDLGFTLEEIKMIEKLPLKDLNHLSRLGAHFLDVKVNHECFATSLRHVQQEAENEAIQEELIRLRAPGAMMQALFGMTPLQYANRRKLLNLAGAGIGRPSEPSEEDQHAVWRAWHRHTGLPEVQRYLETSRTSQVPLNVVWTLVKSWETSAVPKPRTKKPVPRPSSGDVVVLRQKA